jgi:hypothetical protein
MTWEEALTAITKHITKGLKLDKEANYGRPVIEVPPFACTTYDYNGEEGFKVRIGSEAYIEIPISMLQNCFEAARENGGVYKTSIIYSLYPEQLAHHGGYVHVVGRIFEKSGLASKIKGGYALKDDAQD